MGKLKLRRGYDYGTGKTNYIEKLFQKEFRCSNLGEPPLRVNSTILRELRQFSFWYGRLLLHLILLLARKKLSYLRKIRTLLFIILKIFYAEIQAKLKSFLKLCRCNEHVHQKTNL